VLALACSGASADFGRAAATGSGDSFYPELGNGGYDVEHYDVILRYDPDDGAVVASATISATATETLTALSFDFAGPDITDLQVDGTAAAFERDGAELLIEPSAPIAAGRPFSVVVGYEGVPRARASQAAPGEVGWRTDPGGAIFVVSEPDGAHTWAPLNDHPSDKATFSFTITAPDAMTAVANGTLVEKESDAGWTTWRWEHDHPMASYLATMVIGDFEIVPDEAGSAVSSVPIRNVLPPDLASSIPAPLKRQGEMMQFLEEIFGPYPFEVYGIAVAENHESALENQTLSIFGRVFMEDSSYDLETTLVHELAHQWWGNAVSLADWRDIWLKEGLATYAEWLWLEHTEGRKELERTVQWERDFLTAVGFTPPGDPPPGNLYNLSVYVWGALTFHALRIEIGDEAFFDTLRAYFDAYQGSAATTADFIEVAERVSGQELGDLFERWLHSEAPPPLPRPG